MSYSKIKSGTKPSKKIKYRVRNWKEYNQALKNRGRILVWFDEDVATQWCYQGKRSRGGQFTYSNAAIELCLTFRVLFHLALRQTQGFMEDIMDLLEIELPVPDYTRLSRRGKTIDLKIKRYTDKTDMKEDTYLIIDSTGLKIYGAGEWLSEKHGVKPRRAWRKLHIGVNRNGEVLAEALTDHHTDDPSQIPHLLAQVEDKICKAIADGAYDSRPVYEAFQSKQPEQLIKITIPPRKTAKLSLDPLFIQRNNHIVFIEKHGRDKWDYASEYTQQSRSENTFFRYKTIIGNKLRARLIENQKAESTLACNILNKMVTIGMPDSYKVIS